MRRGGSFFQFKLGNLIFTQKSLKITLIPEIFEKFLNSWSKSCFFLLKAMEIQVLKPKCTSWCILGMILSYFSLFSDSQYYIAKYGEKIKFLRHLTKFNWAPFHETTWFFNSVKSAGKLIFGTFRMNKNLKMTRDPLLYP